MLRCWSSLLQQGAVADGRTRPLATLLHIGMSKRGRGMYAGRPRRPSLAEMTADPRINMRPIALFSFAATGTRALAASN